MVAVGGACVDGEARPVVAAFVVLSWLRMVVLLLVVFMVGFPLCVCWSLCPRVAARALVLLVVVEVAAAGFAVAGAGAFAV